MTPTPDLASWGPVPGMFRAGATLPTRWESIFGALRRGLVDDLVVVGQLGQSLDGRIATPTSHSHYINGSAGLNHLHQLRSLVDAVVVGIGTAVADDPQLTVRRVSGPQPARVVIDRSGRLPTAARLLVDDGVRRLVIGGPNARPSDRPDLPKDVEVTILPCPDGHIAPAAILAALAQRGLKRILIEGGAETVSRFLAARCLDRLHVVVAPIILGSGRSGLTLPPIERADEAMRMPIHVHRLDDEVLFDCDLSAHRAPVGRTSTST